MGDRMLDRLLFYLLLTHAAHLCQGKCNLAFLFSYYVGLLAGTGSHQIHIVKADKEIS